MADFSLLETGHHLPLILVGLVRHQEALIFPHQEALANQQHPLASLAATHLPLAHFQLALEPLDSFLDSFLEPLLPLDSFLEPPLLQVDTPQDQVYLDSSLELQDSFLQCLGSFHQVELQCHTQFQGSFLPLLVLHRAPIQMCLTHQVHLALACMAQEDLVPFHLMGGLDMQEECFPQYHQGHGVHMEEVSPLNPVPQEALVQGPWDRMEDLQLQAECHHIDLHIFEYNVQLNQSQEEDHIAEPR
ncbi:hypothetical protein DNTS_008525 [Danionella cerebrum]|uniref:Uncharacterized protein n=1 Tax=Danionella cerebrum TaxID=2873325 RepID=A0A553QN66_9TELE|nr:hypothetical protein DNTS_008525 [Danionella translucida]